MPCYRDISTAVSKRFGGYPNRMDGSARPAVDAMAKSTMFTKSPRNRTSDADAICYPHQTNKADTVLFIVFLPLSDPARGWVDTAVARVAF